MFNHFLGYWKDKHLEVNSVKPHIKADGSEFDIN